MADENLINAKKIYNNLCSFLDAKNMHYDKDDEKLRVDFGMNGDDLPMDFIIFADAERQILRLLSPMPFNFPEDKRMEGAIATCAATFSLADGSFDYDISDGKIVFRMTASFRDVVLGEGTFEYMIACAGATIDKYNDKFFAVGKGLLDITEFIKAEN